MSETATKIAYLVLSLLLAILFWLYVDASKGHMMSQDFNSVPIDFIGAEDTLPSRGLMLASGEDATVDLRLSGPRTVISGLKSSDIRAQVNLVSVNSVGPYSLKWDLVLPDHVNRSDITIERSSRSNVTFQVTTLYSHEIPIDVVIEGEVPEPYVSMDARVVKEPSVLTLSGLRDAVDQIVSARVVVDISNAVGTIQQDYSYELLDAEGNVVADPKVRVSDQSVNVTVPVYMMKELPLTVKFKQSPGSTLANASWNLEPDKITIMGDPLSLETIEEISLGEVDLSAYYEFDEDLEIKLPAGCENASGFKNTHLTIKFHNLSTRSFTVTNIRPAGLSASQRFDLITTSVDVVLRGPADDLEQVMEEDIRIVVDLKEITSDGTVTVPANVYVDGYSAVGAVGASEIQITGKIISS